MAGDSKKLLKVLKKEEKEMISKFNKFAEAWKSHVQDEIKVHQKLLAGKHDLSKHIKETVDINKKFIQKISKL